jgi:son of sevenless-like protein
MCELFKIDKNFTNLRLALKNSITPCIPHIGLFLSDLTFTEEGNKDYIDSMINFSKCRKLAERIAWIKQYQQVGYNFETIPAAMLYFERNMEIRTEDEFWNMSLEVEPREDN